LLKIFSKILLGLRPSRRRRKTDSRGFFKNPLLYFGAIAFFLFGLIYTSCANPVSAGALEKSHLAFSASFQNSSDNPDTNDLFSSKVNEFSLETPDLKIIQNNAIGGISAPYIVSGKVLGDVFGGSPVQSQKKEVIDYEVQPGDTLQSIANSYEISLNTLLWANDITSSSTLKVGQNLTILPTDGILHVIKSGDTVSGISKTYNAGQSNIISFNGLANEDDIYIGDILIVPGGVMPKKATPVAKPAQIPMASNYFIFPTQGTITQGLHYYNAIDIANKCGTPVYAAAAGTVQRAVGNGGWNSGMGNHITILHGNGTVTYYGHLSSVLVKPGDKVNVGDRIGLIGNTGKVIGVTGCHLHFQVVGAKNPLASYRVGSKISYK